MMRSARITSVALLPLMVCIFSYLAFAYSKNPTQVTTNGTLHFETIKSNSEYDLKRAKVPGGWLIEIGSRSQPRLGPGGRDVGGSQQPGVSLTFMPDPDHKWDNDH